MPAFRLQLPFSSTSPNAAGTVVGAAISLTSGGSPVYTGLDDYGAVLLDCLVRGATGGTLDIYFQSSIKGGRWYDVAHLPQLAAGAALVRYAFSISRARGGGSATPLVVNPADDTPTLAANTVLTFTLGDALRMVYVAGVGTSLGAAQVIDGAAYQI